MHPRAGEDAVFDLQPVEPREEAHFAAAGDDIPPDGPDHAAEHVRADVRLGVVKDLLLRAVLVKLPQHPGDAPVVRAGVELAVGKGPGAALAELDVVLLVQLAAGAEALDRRKTGIDVAAALEHDRPRPRVSEQQGGEHARRTEADDDGTLGASDLRDRIFFFPVRGHVGALVFREQPGFFFSEPDGERADVMDIVLLPRVERALDEPKLRDLLRPDAQLFRRALLELVSVLAGHETQTAQKDHLPSLPASAPLDQAHWRL